MRNFPEYSVLNNMIRRCHDPKNDAYHNYGGRGIFVCQEWRASFTAFYAHVGPRPTPKHTIERMDNNRGYEPGNVTWATRIRQARNKRNNRILTFHGKSQTVAEWAEELGLIYEALSNRLNRNKWDLEKALTTPCMTPTESARVNSKLSWPDILSIRASTESGKSLAERYGVGEMTISRIKRGIRWAKEF